MLELDPPAGASLSAFPTVLKLQQQNKDFELNLCTNNFNIPVKSSGFLLFAKNLVSLDVIICTLYINVNVRMPHARRRARKNLESSLPFGI